MASGPNPVTITIGGDAGPLRAAAQQAGSHLEEMKKGMGRARETAMFFTQALGEMGPQGRTAQIAISGIAGALIGGGGMIAVLGLAQAAVRMLADAWGAEAEAAKKAREEDDKRGKEIADRLTKAATEEARAKFVAAGGLADQYDRINSRLEKESQIQDMRRPILERLAPIEKRLAGFREENLQWLDMESMVGKDYLADKAEEARLKAQLLKIEEALASTRRASALDAKSAETAGKASSAEAAITAAAAKAKEDYALYIKMVNAVFERELENARRLREEMLSDTSAIGLPNAADLDAALGNEPSVWAAGWSAAADTVGDSMRGMAQDVVGAFRPMLTQSAAYSRAMRAAGKSVEDASDLSGPAFAAMAQNALAGLAIEAATRALFYTAEGIADVLVPGKQPMAANKFAAAAIMMGIAGTAGAGAYAIGQNRGMTAAERAQVDSDSGGGSGGANSGAPRGDGGGGERVVRETVFIVGGAGFTEAELARAAARSLRSAERLGYMRGATVTEGA